MKIQILTAVAALAIAAPAVAQAGCADFQVTGSELSVSYDPFNASPIERTFTLRVQRMDSSAGAVRFILVDPDTAGGVTRIGQGPEGYDIRAVRDGSRPMLFQGAEQPNNANGLLVAFGDGPSGDVVTETLRLSIPAGRSVEAGDYFEPLEVRFACQTGDAPLGPTDFQQGTRVAIDLRVPELMSTYIGAPGVVRGQIAFGQLTAGGGVVNRNLVVTAQSTVPYTVDIDSARGRLQRSDRDDYGLDYALRFSGVPVSAGATVTCSRSPAPSGRNHALEVGLNQAQVGQVPAGAYSDTITLSFTPRLGLSGGVDGCSSGL